MTAANLRALVPHLTDKEIIAKWKDLWPLLRIRAEAGYYTYNTNYIAWTGTIFQREMEQLGFRVYYLDTCPKTTIIDWSEK